MGNLSDPSITSEQQPAVKKAQMFKAARAWCTAHMEDWLEDIQHWESFNHGLSGQTMFGKYQQSLQIMFDEYQ